MSSLWAFIIIITTMRNLPVLYITRSHVGRDEPSALHWPACVAFCCEVQWISWWSFIIVNFSLHCNCFPCLSPYCSLPLSIHLYPQCMYGVWHIEFIGLKLFTFFKCYWQVKWDLIIWLVMFFGIEMFYFKHFGWKISWNIFILS